MKLNTIWDFAVWKWVDYFAIFGVPQVDLSVVRGAQKFRAVRIEAYISDCLAVPSVRSQAFSVCQNIPDFARSVLRSWQNQVAILRKETDFLHAFWVARIGENPLFWYKISSSLFCFIFYIGRSLQKCLFLTLNMQNRLLLILFCFMLLILPISFFLRHIFKLVFDHVFVFFNCLILFSCQRGALLVAEISHAVVLSPGPFVVCFGWVASLLPFHFPFFFHLFFAFFIFTVFKLYIAIFKFICGEIGLLQKSSEMILRVLDLIFIFKFCHFFDRFLDL